MVFATGIISETVLGNRRCVIGYWTNGVGDSGGDLVTGLESVDFVSLQEHLAAVSTDTPVVNEVLAGDTDPMPTDVTIVTVAGSDGRYLAIGSM